MITGYIAQGYNVANRTPTSVTLIKRKQFSILWAVIGFVLCLLPLLIYLIVYAAESDQMVVITLMGAQPAHPAIAAAGTIPLNAPRSPDGQYWWDGQQWRPVGQGTGPMGQITGPMNQAGVSMPLQSRAATPADPATAPRSPDGRYWWDGQAWRPVVQGTGPMGQATEPTSEGTEPENQGMGQMSQDGGPTDQEPGALS